MEKKLLSFAGGVHPPHSKHFTEDKKVELCTVPAVVTIPLQQHIGAPCEPLVKAGDTVKLGQKIGQPKGFVSAPVHSSVSGKVKAVEPVEVAGGGKVLAVVIENDGLDTKDETIVSGSIDKYNDNELKNIVLEAGIVGMGGAAFPTHVKLSPSADKKIDTIILNGAECEPYLTSDYRLMIENPQKVIYGLKVLMKIMGVKAGYIGIEDNKPKAVKAMKDAAGSDDAVRIVTLRTKYPQGAEKQLIYAITGRQVPSGGLPMDVGAIVNNVGTAAAIADVVQTGEPLYQRIVTVTGGGVKEPKNLLVRIGTPFSAVLDFCGGISENTAKVISGGPMMGIAQHTLNVPVVKGTSGILVLTEEEARIPLPSACIRCGRCVSVCPMNLLPLTLSAQALNRNYEEAEKMHAMDCIECGSCSFVCPANRPLVDSIRVAKREITAARKRNAKA